MDQPPLRLLWGVMAVRVVEQASSLCSEADKKWRELSVSTDPPEPGGAASSVRSRIHLSAERTQARATWSDPKKYLY